MDMVIHAHEMIVVVAEEIEIIIGKDNGIVIKMMMNARTVVLIDHDMVVDTATHGKFLSTSFLS